MPNLTLSEAGALAADALVRTGPTHTNVADVVVGLRVGS